MLVITWIKTWCFCMLHVNHSGEYKGKKKVQSCAFPQTASACSALRLCSWLDTRNFCLASQSLAPSSTSFHLPSVASSSANRTTCRKASAFLLHDQSRDPRWVYLLSLWEALTHVLLFLLFQSVFLQYCKYRGKQGSMFPRRLLHPHGSDNSRFQDLLHLRVQSLTFMTDLSNGLE